VRSTTAGYGSRPAAGFFIRGYGISHQRWVQAPPPGQGAVERVDGNEAPIKNNVGMAECQLRSIEVRGDDPQNGLEPSGNLDAESETDSTLYLNPIVDRYVNYVPLDNLFEQGESR